MTAAGPLPAYGYPPRAGYAAPPRRPWWIVSAVAVAAIVTVGVVLWLLLPRYPARFGLWFPIGGLLLIFLVVWIALAAVRISFWGSRRQRYWAARSNLAYGRPGGFDPAIRTARMRYARGEITRDQYEEIVRGLRPGPPAP